MENYRFTLPLLPAPGKLTTVYHVDGGVARNAVLTTMAAQLSERASCGAPVLMIDWDTESPGLHEQCGPGGRPAADAARPGLLEYVAACRAQLALLHEHAAPASLSALDAELHRARLVFEAVDWEPFIERVDASRPLYLMRAGCIDDSYGERAAGADWEGLFAASPSLYRCFADHFTRRFGHVVVASRGGRSAAVSVCTTLLPDHLLMLFSPTQRSLDGACGVVRRAIEYRSCHEEAQRPLLVYPLPIELDGADLARRLRWRHGDDGGGAGYQSVMEALLRECYGLEQLSLDSYFDHVQLQQLTAMTDAPPARLPRTADRLSLPRALADLLDWAADGAFPWLTRAELAPGRRIAATRAADPDAVSPALQTALAADLLELGAVQQRHGRQREALASLTEAVTVQTQLWGAGHADTRPGRLALGAQLRRCGKADAAVNVFRCLYDELVQDCGDGHPDTLAARAGMAAALADCRQFEAAVGHAAQVVTGWRERCGLNYHATLDAQALHAALLARAGEAGRARMLFEQVLEGRERILGREHADTIATEHQLAVILRQMGHLDIARGLQEQVLATRQRLLGSDHDDTIEAALALAETVAAQCDLQGVSQLCGPLAAACQRRYGRSHPPGRSAELEMASLLAAESAAAAVPASHWRPVSAGAPHESGFAALSHEPGRPALAASGALSTTASTPAPAERADLGDIERGVLRLEQMEDLAAVEARELADRLREPALTAALGPLVRQRAVRAILGVYVSQGDTDAVVALIKEQTKVNTYFCLD